MFKLKIHNTTQLKSFNQFILGTKYDVSILFDRVFKWDFESTRVFCLFSYHICLVKHYYRFENMLLVLICEKRPPVHVIGLVNFLLWLIF